MVKKSFILSVVLMAAVMMTGCKFGPKELKKPQFARGWYIYEGMTTRYFLYYYTPDEILFGGIQEQRFEGESLELLKKNYKYDDAYQNLYYMTGEKITNKLNDENEYIERFVTYNRIGSVSIDEYSHYDVYSLASNAPEWMKVRIEYDEAYNLGISRDSFCEFTTFVDNWENGEPKTYNGHEIYYWYYMDEE